MKIVVASDHGGFDLKAAIIKHLKESGHQSIDGGTFDYGSCHYPSYAIPAGELVASGQADFGIVICNTGIGISIAANKVKGVRCAVAYDDRVVELTRRDNDANMIAFGAHFMKLDDVLRRVDLFLETPFDGGRHKTRVDIIKDYEDKHYCQ
ncbi:MAG: ribose 5-phosphate isomerase B [Bacilli bacterium]|jgi:ribose 5-phosphate isomerase B